MLSQQVLVFGAGGAGKSELLQALAGSRLPPGAVTAGEGLTALAQVERERDRAPIPRSLLHPGLYSRRRLQYALLRGC